MNNRNPGAWAPGLLFGPVRSIMKEIISAPGIEARESPILHRTELFSMTLFLTSSPCIYDHSPATLSEANGFLRRIRSKLPPKPKTLFVASSPSREDHARTDFYAGDMAGAFARAGIELPGWQLLDDLTADRARELVAWSDFIILMGGHVPTQNAFFNRINLKRLLQGYPGVIMGISAGTMNAAETVYAQPESDGETAPSFRRFYPGLGLTHINVCPHYQQVKDWILDGKRLYGEVTESDSKLGHAFHIFPDGTYIYKDEQEYAIFGQCWRMQNGITELLTGDGERLDLK